MPEVKIPSVKTHSLIPLLLVDPLLNLLPGRWSAADTTAPPVGEAVVFDKNANPETRSLNPAKPLAPLVLPRQPDGAGTVVISGELKQWHKVTLTLDGPFAHERDMDPNPFTD